MVYESDFYTTRRPYSRPTVTSYSVTRREVPWHKVPLVPRPSQVAPCFTVFGSQSVPDDGLKLQGLGKGQTFHRHIPLVAHKRIVTVSPSAHVSRTRQSVLLGEIDRIYHKVRPCLAYQPTEDYLNSHSMVSFDDETRSIRAKTAELLKRIHTPVPRAQRPLPLPGEDEYVLLPDDWHNWYSGYPEEMGQTRLRLKLQSLKKDLQDLRTNAYYSHTELPITARISSDNYIDRLLSANKDVARDINTMSYFEQPAKHYNSIGRGHLACVSFAGGRPILKRRNLADSGLRDDINVLSHYGRFRSAAAKGTAAAQSEPEYTPSTRRAPTKSSVTGSWKSNAPRNQEARSGNLTAAEEFDAAQDRKQRRRDAVEAAATREVEEEKRRKGELSRQDELAQQALIDRQLELERKAREEEEERIRREEEERLDAERKAQEEEERLIREEEERIAREVEEQRLKEDEEKKAKKAKKEAEKKAKEAAERKAQEEAEEKARLEAEEKAREEEDRKAKEEAERLAKEEAERLQKEELERLAREEADRKAKEEEEQRLKDEADKLAKEEEDRKANEEADRLAAEEAAAAERDAAAAEAQAVTEDVSPTDDAEAAQDPVVEEPAENPEEEPVKSEDVEEVEDDEEEEEEE